MDFPLREMSMPPAFPKRNSSEPVASTVRVVLGAMVTVKSVAPLLVARTHTISRAVN
jgi:hypothetical protein